MGSKRHYTFTRPGETLEFDTAKEAREHFYMNAASFPSCYVDRTWDGWKVTAGEYHDNRFTREAK